MLGAEMWTCLSGSLPGWLIFLILVFIFQFGGFRYVGYNSASGFRMIYDEIHRKVFPKVSWLRNNFNGTILRIHDGDHCMCSHSYGFFEYFIYRSERRVARKGFGGVSLADFLQHPVGQYDLMIVDFPVRFGVAFIKKISLFSNNFILRINSTIGPVNTGRYMTHNGAHYYVADGVTDEQFYGYFGDVVACGQLDKPCSSPTEDLLMYLSGKRVQCSNAVDEFAHSCSVYFGDAKIFAFSNSMYMINCILDMIDYVTSVDKKFDTQVMFEILLLKRFVESDDSVYYREKQMARLIRKIVINHRKKRVRKTLLLLHRTYCERDNVVLFNGQKLPNLLLVQDFNDYNRSSCQDYFELPRS